MHSRKKANIIYFTKYTDKGPNSRYRSYQYKKYLDKEFNLIFYPFFDDVYVTNLYDNKKTFIGKIIYYYLRRIFHILSYLWTDNIIFIEYELLPYFPSFFENLLARTNVKFVLDFDDAIFHNYDQHNNRFVRFFLKNKIPTISKMATFIITGSPYLTNFFRNYTNNIIEIPTSISLEKYKISNCKNNYMDKVTIGWIGSKSTSINVINIKEAILKVSEQHANVIFKFMGFNKRLMNELKGQNIEYVDWSPTSELPFLNSIDIGIMPLDNNDFNKGKCGFKLIQYMAVGKPTISTPFKTNVKINRGNKNLFAENYKEWIDCMDYFICNPNVMRKVGESNVNIVENYYSVESNSSCYIKLFKEIKDVRY